MLAHPLRFTICSTIAFALFWLISTKSLPYALVPYSPSLALALNPNNPEALLAEARQVRARLLAPVATAEANAGESPERGNTVPNLAEAKEGNLEPSASERAALREEIASLASRVIANDPLNAEAYRMLGEVAQSPDEARKLMETAVSYSRREAVAVFWLLNDRFYHRDFEAALRYAGVIMRTHEELTGYVVRYAIAIAENEQGLPLVAQALASKPVWRKAFFQALPGDLRRVDTPMRLIRLLKGNGSPVSPKEATPYLEALIDKNAVEAAYNAWLETLNPGELDLVDLVTNGHFERDPSGVPFDWRLREGVNAVAEIVPLATDSKKRALHVQFGTGRVKFPEAVQTIVLGSGRYRFQGQLRGKIAGKRGLRWQLSCATGTRRVLGETDMLSGEAQEWRIFAFEANVPGGDCSGQILRLYHDARSASEEFLTGEIWFGGMEVTSISNPTTAAR